MSDAPFDPRADSFADRYALASFADGGIVLDVITGNYARLNVAATKLLETLQRTGSEDRAAEDLSSRLGVPRSVILRDLRAVVEGLNGEGARTEATPLIYRRAGDGGYDLCHRQQVALHVDASGRRLTLGGPPDLLPLSIFDYVSDMAPKLAFLQGLPVLHGSSVRDDDGILGMCGRSRAGKTTTARTFVRHGRTLSSEDLIVLDPDLATARAFVGGEARIHQWAREASKELARGEGASVDPGLLREAASGPTAPLKAIWFLDAARRGDAIRLRVLPKPDGLAQLLANAFLGAGGDAAWRMHLATGRAVVSAITPYEAHVPDGLERLDAAIAAYSTNSAS